MPFIKELWVASLTSEESDSGSDNQRVIIMNQNDVDVIHLDLGFGAADTGGGNLHRHDISEFPEGILPEDYYMRIGIRGYDAWRPTMIAAWCERFTTGNVVLLGYDETIEQVLSADSSEGRISLPLNRVGRGRVRMNINRVMLIVGTGGLSNATDSPVRVRITSNGALVVDHTISDTPQADFESFEGNVYYMPVISSFRRSQLDDASIELSIEGDDAWRPMLVILFGLDTGAGQPNEIVPLVHIHPWMFDRLSTDPDEGVASVKLPLAPMDA